MGAKGLVYWEMANGRKAWFQSVGYISDKKVEYSDMFGKIRRKRLTGFSEKRKVHWHFAMDVYPYIVHDPIMFLRPHVVFTDDGIKPISSSLRMQRLRQGFCRSWWNDRWRDLMLAYTTYISDESGFIQIPVGSENFFVLDPKPSLLESPVSLDTEMETVITDDETDEQLDTLADMAELDNDYDIEEDENGEKDQIKCDEEWTADHE